MRRKILSGLMVAMMLLMAVGCGGNSSKNKIEETSDSTEVNFTFKTVENRSLQKVSDITKVWIYVKKGNTFIYEGKPASKVDGKWSAKLSLKKNDGPYVFDTRAYNGGTLLYQGITETTATLPASLLLSLVEVTPTLDVSTLPSLQNVKVYSQDDKEVRMKFTVLNPKRDKVNYNFSLAEIGASSSLPILITPPKGGGGGETAVDIGSIAPKSGTLSFNVDEKTFNAIYTRPTVGTPQVKATLLLTNEKGDEVTIPFDIPTYEEQNIVINFPPEISKIHVLDEGDKFTIRVEVTDVDSTAWTYKWFVLRGDVTVVGATNTAETLSLANYDSTVNPNLCIDIKVTDDAGASSKVGYCLKGDMDVGLKLKKTGQTKSYDANGDEVTNSSVKDDGFYQKGVTPSYTRNNTNNTVKDNLTGLVWQDDEDVNANTYTWEEAKSYCNTLTLGGFSDWRLPTRKELVGLSDYGRSDLAINPSFAYVKSNYYWSSTTDASYSNDAWFVNFNSGYQNSHGKNTNHYVRCVRAGQ